MGQELWGLQGWEEWGLPREVGLGWGCASSPDKKCSFLPTPGLLKLSISVKNTFTLK